MPFTSKKKGRAPQIKEKNVHVDAEKVEDLKLVASLVDWSTYDKIMGKIFYDNFGKVLEQKVDAFQQTKAELKAYIRENYANPRVIFILFLLKYFLRLYKHQERLNPLLLSSNKSVNSRL